MTSSGYVSTGHHFGGLKLSRSDLPGAVQEVLTRARRGGAYAVHLCSGNNLTLASEDESYAALLNRSDLNLADGWGAVLASATDPPLLRERVPGPELFERVLEAGVPSQVRHYFLGATEDTRARLESAVSTKFPGAQVVGGSSPPFRRMTPAEVEAQDASIRSTGAQIVWVGLGAPKQDWETARIARELDVTAVAVGAAFDFTAGTLRRAPGWMRRGGLEWLYRLLQEPRRLWRRYLIGNSKLVVAVARASVTEARRRREDAVGR